MLREVFVDDTYAPPDTVRRALSDLRHPMQVLDVGANIGLFALRCFDWFPDAVVTSLEPDPRNFATLERARAQNPGLRWKLVQAAAGPRDGEARFVSDFSMSQLASVADSFGGHLGHTPWIPADRLPPIEQVTVQVTDLFAHLDGCDLLKLDIQRRRVGAPRRPPLCGP